MSTGKPIRLPLPNTEEWVVLRFPENPSAGWYFLNRVSTLAKKNSKLLFRNDNDHYSILL